MADGCTLKAAGIGDVPIELLNGSRTTNTLLKETIHVPEIAFTLISISKLDQAKYNVTFNSGMCTTKNPAGEKMGTIPCSNRLYHLFAPETRNAIDYTNIMVVDITLTQAHCKLGHKGYAAIKHAISTGSITGIELELSSKHKFCEPCAKAKVLRQPFPKQSAT